MNRLCVTALSSLAILVSNAAFAQNDEPAYIASAEQKQILETAVKGLSPSIRNVSCTHVIYVFIGGRSTATAGACTLDGQAFQLNCFNESIGITGSSVRLQPEQTVESELRSLIRTQCIGG